MKNDIILVLSILIYSITAYTQSVNNNINEAVSLTTEEGTLHGTLLTKNSDHPIPLVIFISGSGPTDRDGNQANLKTDCFKQLANHLIEQEVASLRFDKRYIGQSTEFSKDVSDILFDDFVKDISNWIIKYLDDPRFSKILVMGHSLGALMGILAIDNLQVDGFISIAGPSNKLSQTLYDQLYNQSPFLAKGAKPIIDSIEAGHQVKEVHPLLSNIFPKYLHNYLSTVFKYNPAQEIGKLDLPILIIQGTTDIQVTVEDAENLHENSRNSTLHIIENMNHILKEAPLDRIENIATYNQPELEINPKVSDLIVQFIMNLNQQ